MCIASTPVPDGAPRSNAQPPTWKELPTVLLGLGVSMDICGLVGGCALAVMVKLVSEISKKILPTASTLMRAVVVLIFGTMIASLPSLGVLATMVVGKVWPPSLES